MNLRMMHGRSRRALIGGLFCGGFAVMIPRTGEAQWAATAARKASGPTQACLDTIPQSAFRRSVVYIEAVPADSIKPEYVVVEDNLARAVAASARQIVGGDTTFVRPGEPSMTWRALASSLLLTLYRNGSIHVATGPSYQREADVPGVGLLTRALQMATDTAHAFSALGPASADSVHALLHFVAPTFDHAGRPETVTAHAPFPAMTLAQPWVEQVRETHQPRLQYPEWLRQGSASAQITLQIQVDERGYADSSTARAVWQSSEPQPKAGVALAAYTTFVNTAKAALPKFGFEPARIGGCPVPSTAALRFIFSIAP